MNARERTVAAARRLAIATGRGLVALARRPSTWAVVLVAAMSATTWSRGAAYIEDVSSTLAGIRELVSGDAEDFLSIADEFSAGDFSMSWVQPGEGPDRAHRQPGFPAMLAAAEALGAKGAPALAKVNLAVLAASIAIAFACAFLATGSLLAGLLAAAAIHEAPFLDEIATGRLLAEPLYVAVALPAVAACHAYAARSSASALLVAAGFAGLAFTVRFDGLFLGASVGIAIVVADLRRARQEAPEAAPSQWMSRLPGAAYAAAFGIFAFVAAASWAPRLWHAGDPLYHGRLSNYLWVDEFDRANVPGQPAFGPSTYADEHGPGQALTRAAYGIRRVLLETPPEEYGPRLAFAVLLASVVVVLLRDRPGLVLLSAGLLAALPLVWVAMPNPTRRIPAAALLPFAAMLLAAAADAAMRWSAGRDALDAGDLRVLPSKRAALDDEA